MLVRPAQAVDVHDISAIQVETWRAAYRGQMPDAVLDGLDVECGTVFLKDLLGQSAHLLLVAEESGSIRGFCYLRSTRDKDADAKTVAEIVAIYIRPAHWRQGIGRALFNYALAAARRDGYQAVTLWVLASNDSAKRFYETIGFRPDGATKMFKTKGGIELPEVRFQITL